jgi:SAM-dependent methyltransferase
MPQFASRTMTPELMDTEPVGFETFRACLADLAAVNRLTGAYRPTLSFLERLRRAGRLDCGRPVRIVDVGSGYGDMLRRIDLWAQSHGVPVDLTGVDLNPWSARAAAEATPAGRPIRWLTADAFAYEGDIDLAVSSLFTHHLDDEAVARFVTWMESRAGIGWFVNDLHRQALPYYGFALLARLMRWHRFVRHDGPVSIARSFRTPDWLRLSTAAGLAPGVVEVTREFPYRLCVARVFPA